MIKFEVYRQYDLVPRAERPSYRDLAHRAGIKETDVVNYLRAVRELVRSEVRSELGETAPDGADGEAEWNGFFQR